MTISGGTAGGEAEGAPALAVTGAVTVGSAEAGVTSMTANSATRLVAGGTQAKAEGAENGCERGNVRVVEAATRQMCGRLGVSRNSWGTRVRASTTVNNWKSRRGCVRKPQIAEHGS